MHCPTATTLQRYGPGHFIDVHDDVAQGEFDGVVLDRDIAMVFYLTTSTDRDGGAFLDHVDQEAYPPVTESARAHSYYSSITL